MKTIRVGCGAGFAGDRIEPAVELAERGRLDYLGLECLAERTIALAQQARRTNPDAGYDSLLTARFEALLPVCRRNGVKIITNMGAANPAGAAKVIAAMAARMGFTGLRIAAVEGDDVLDQVLDTNLPFIERQGSVRDIAGSIISANAYLGVAPIIEALAGGADVVITGRVSDPALFAAPLIYEFGWDLDDWHRVGHSMLIGHLLECAGQVTGGYFADPGYKTVANLARIGLPFVDAGADGTASIGKPDGSGGQISIQTCKEQLLYEVHDPAAYFQPDVVADFSGVRFTQDGPDRVGIHGGTGHKRTDTLKVTIGYRDGYIGEGQMSYAGPGALARAQLALDIVRERIAIIGVKASEVRYDLIGVNAVHRGAGGSNNGAEPEEIRIRVAGRTDTAVEANRIGIEVESLWLNGPAGGGGAWKSTREVVAAASVLLPRAGIKTSVRYEVA